MWDYFGATTVGQGKVCEINQGIVVKVKAITPVRLSAVGLEPMRCKDSQTPEILSEYPDGVCGIELPAGL